MAGKSRHIALGNAAERLKQLRVVSGGPAPAPAAPQVSAGVAPPKNLPKEGGEAVAVTRSKPVVRLKRPYRLGTYLNAEAGARLDRLVYHLKTTRGRRMSASDVIEQALVLMERELGL